MTVDDLVRVYLDGYEKHPGFADEPEAYVASGLREVIRALRDEMDDKGHYEIYLMFNEILGSDAGEKVAGEVERLKAALEDIDAVAVDFGYYEAAARTMKEIALKALRAAAEGSAPTPPEVK